MPLRDGIGLWYHIHAKPAPQQPAIFLDRDGVLVKEVHYLRRVEDVHLYDVVPRAIQEMETLGFSRVIITNQAGVGRGLFHWGDFEAVQQEMLRQLTEQARINAVYACGYIAVGQEPYNKDHSWRKPNPGMIKAAEDDLDINLSASWVIGDRAADIEAGARAGLRGGVLVATGYGANQEEQTKAASLKSASFCVMHASDIGEAWEKIKHAL